MNNEIKKETKRIDHLGIVAGICQQIGLIETIDQIMGERRRKVSCGEAVQAMILNALGFSGRALYMMPDYLHNKPVDMLISKELSAEDFNDDSLGRCLDELYEQGVTEVFAGIATHALHKLEIMPRFFHLDTSSFHLHGEYEDEGADEQAIEITRGYSKDYRPDLNQVVLSLITAQRSTLPVWLEVLSGNSSDKKSFPRSVKAYFEQFATGTMPYLVMDSAGYSQENLQEIEKICWLMRVPETIQQARQAIEEIDQMQMIELASGYWGKEIASEYGEVKQRWLVIFSQTAYQREVRTLGKRQTKELEKVQSAWRKLCRTTYNCEADGHKAHLRFNQQWKYHQAAAQIETLTGYSRAGRPSTKDALEVKGYQLTGEIVPVEEKLTAAKSKLGKFIVATNQLDAQQLSAQEMLTHYIDQGVSVERGFRFLKDPLFFAHSLFLKKPTRIMALLMVMGLALLIYSLAERQLRERLQETGDTVPDQKRKSTQTPTMRWIFQLFEGIDLLLTWQGDQLISREVLNLRDEHLTIIHLLGPPVENCYLLSD